MALTDSIPTQVHRTVEQLTEAGEPVISAVREAAVRAGETARTLAYAYVGALDLVQEQVLRAARFSR